MDHDSSPLSLWDQSSTRAYINVVLCFPFEDEKVDEATSSLEQSCRLLAQQFPVLTGDLALRNDGMQKHTIHPQTPHERRCIPFERVSCQLDFPTYSQLRDRGFPASDFVGRRLGAPGTLQEGCKPVPVMRFQALFISGGLLLSLHLHHSVMDGECMKIILDALATATRGESISVSQESLDLKLPGRTRRDELDESKANFEQCPEFAVQTGFKGPMTPALPPFPFLPTSMGNIGRIFRFRSKVIDELRGLLLSGESPGPFSSFTCLSALSWAHVAKANHSVASTSQTESYNMAKLMVPVSWRQKIFQGSIDGYFGNATAFPIAETREDVVREAAEDVSQLLTVASAIQRTIKSVDEQFVLHRLDLFESIPDWLMLGVNMQPAAPSNLKINTWRHIGADTEWKIPGVLSSKPDAIRQGQARWSPGKALILPAKAGSDFQEVLIVLSIEAMEKLTCDEGWLKWVDGTI